ncbi:MULTISPECIES: TRAP transporter small permease subunit [unclassified Thalassospira]|mgnify:CR=1 FL=1|jgi:TRAP-type C4-dicarboxylate transport system permease small subunit|uniref:TRAP transporter small permease subunit n=1 Tax=unclassified Thalassospira TaxID=2648997 RepID=UPI001FEDB98B|nr:TRAP transporter small permease [Thalassospira sp. MCCC 1A01428]
MTNTPHSDPHTPLGTSEGDVAELIDDNRAVMPAESGLFGRCVNYLGSIFAIGFLCSMAALIFEICMRHIFNAPTIWAHETTTFLCAMGFVFAGLFCASRNQHIRVVIIYDMVSPKARRILNIVISLICAVSSGFFAFAAWLMVKRAAFSPNGGIRLETSGSAWNPPFPAILKIFMLVIMVALTIQFLILAYNYARQKLDVSANDATVPR